MKRRGVTFVEVMVAIAIFLPIVAIAWQALSTSRQSERGNVAMGSAIRGAAILKRTLRRDFNRADISLNEPWFKFDGKELTFTVAVAQPGAGIEIERRVVKYRILQLDVPDEELCVIERDGKIIDQVTLKYFNLSINSRDLGLWVNVEIEALDPALTKKNNGQFYNHSTTILLRGPWAPVTPGLFKYGLQEANDGASSSAWVERVDNKYIVCGVKGDGAVAPKIVMNADGTEYPLVLGRNAKNTIETKGTEPYSRFNVTYQTSLRSLFGTNYRNRKYDFSLGYVTGSERQWFWRAPLYPSASVDFYGQEVFLCAARRWFDGSEPSLEVFLASVKPGRPAYIVVYKNLQGKWTGALAHQIDRGLYHAELAGFPATSALSSLSIKSR